MAKEFSGNGVVEAETPVCFGTMAGNGDDCTAPTATKRVLLKVKPADGDEYFLNDEQDRHLIARSYMILAGHCGPEALTEMRDILDESVLACAFHSSSSGHSIGYKSAYRISKLERMNGDHRKNVRKLTVEPYDEHIAALVWSRASVNAFEESLNDVAEQVLLTRNGSDENFLDMSLKREINNEHNYQCNCLPILGTALSPYNLSSGGNDPTGTILETYVEEEFGEELEHRLSNAYDEEAYAPFFQDPFTSVQNGITTTQTATLGGGDFGHICEQCDRGCIYFGRDEAIIKDDFLHPKVLKEMQNCASRMELKLEGGKVFLSPAEVSTEGAKERAYDFSVLPAVSAALKGKKKHVGRLMHTDSICWQMGQLLNGRAIDTELNNKNNRDVSYVVTAVEINRGQALTPSKFRGNSIMLKWGETTTPVFVDESATGEKNQEDCWYARLFYEVPADAHEKLQAHVEGHKSSALEISEETAALMGFESYFLPSVRNEVKAVMKHGIFGRSADKKDVTDKNVITSRLVVVIKVDLGTGRVSRVKSRWVSRGFQDRRFGKKGEGLDCRSHTMSDASFLFLLQFAQSIRARVWLGDVTEAFLLGLTFAESYGEEYFKNPNSRVWMEVPKTIRGMSEFNFKELVELIKSIYGCKDAPLNWQKTLSRILSLLQLKQSLIDPSLWCAFATPQEEKILAQGEKAVEEYFWQKIGAIDKLERSDAEGAAEVICGQEEKLLRCNIFKASEEEAEGTSKQFVNPVSDRLAGALTQHYQNPGVLIGAMGSHVDDTCNAGNLLFMLRIYALFRKFPLGSWTGLMPGQRDSFIGRELQVVPSAIDQYQLNKMLESKREELQEKDIDVEEEYYINPEEEALEKVEREFGISRDQKPHTYEKAANMQCDAATLAKYWRVDEDVAYVVSQETYAQKMKTISKEEVLQFYRDRDRATNKWMRKKVSNPFRKTVGELLWLAKSNAIIAAATSDAAGELLKAEQANSWAAVEHYVNDLNGLIMLAQFGESSCRRICRIANLKEHILLGCGDASKSRVGGSLNLFGDLSSRMTCISFFSKIPRRVFSSSTGIELLAQRMLTSELVFAMQIALDLHLIQLGTPVLQLGDNKNLLSEPNEKNLKLDYHAISQLREENILNLRHIPGPKNWTDALTKEPREVILLLLYLNTVWGIADKRVLAVIKDFQKTGGKVKTKKEKDIMQILEEEEGMMSDEEEDESKSEHKIEDLLFYKTTGG
eukprot:g18671.t1